MHGLNKTKLPKYKYKVAVILQDFVFFSRWLQKKREQAKEDAAKKEHYRKLYFSQPQKLKAHTREWYGHNLFL